MTRVRAAAAVSEQTVIGSDQRHQLIQRTRQRITVVSSIFALTAALSLPTAAADPLPIESPETPGLVTFATMSPMTQAEAIVSTPDGLLATLDRPNGIVNLLDPQSLTAWSQVQLDADDEPSDLAVAANGNLWVVTCKGNLYEVPRAGGTLLPAQKRMGIGNSKCDDMWHAIQPLVAVSPKDGSVWAANSDSMQVHRYDPSTGRSEELKGITRPSAQGQNADDIQSLTIDQAGVGYIGFNVGGTVYEPATSTSNVVSLADGSTPTFVSFFSLPNGAIGMTGRSERSSSTNYGTVNNLGQLTTMTAALSTALVGGTYVAGPDGLLYTVVYPTAGTTGTPTVYGLDPNTGALTAYPFDPAGRTGPWPSWHDIAFTETGLAWITGTNSGRLAVMTTPSTGTSPCTPTSTVPVGVAVQCTSIVAPTSTIVSAQYSSADGKDVRGTGWVPGPDDIGVRWTATLTFRTPGTGVLQQRTSTPFTVATQTVTSVTPLSGPRGGGVPITITGTGFAPGMNVFLTDDPAEDQNLVADVVEVVNATTITAVMPPYNEDLSIRQPLWVGFGWTDPDEPEYLAKSPQPFSYDGTPPPAPQITSVTPNKIPFVNVNVPVTITGANFTKYMTVSFNGVPALSKRFDSPTQITAVTPLNLPIATGNVVVDPGYGLQTATAPFTVDGPSTITAITPTTGSSLGTDPVVITGTGFNNTTVVRV